jgi:hypothetical protein
MADRTPELDEVRTQLAAAQRENERLEGLQLKMLPPRLPFIPPDAPDVAALVRERELRDQALTLAQKYRVAEDEHEMKYGRSQKSLERCTRLAHQLDDVLGKLAALDAGRGEE